MTQKEFWAKARVRTWRVVGTLRVVRARGACPVAVVLDPEASGLCGPNAAARILGLPPKFTGRVANAADDCDSPDRPWLLQKLGVGSRPPRNPQ